VKAFMRYLKVVLFLFVALSLKAQTLQPGDGIKITFLDISGSIQMPFIGIINTNNKSFSAIKTEIISSYDSLYRNPKITILALYKINVLGEVRTPGYYYVTEVEKLTGILAMAGGLTDRASLENITILRGDSEVELDAQSIIEQGNTAADFGLRSGDRIFVPKDWWSDSGNVTLIISAIALVITTVALFLR
jgi:protein involved in polysaccharide export with SLBB domain